MSEEFSKRRRQLGADHAVLRNEQLLEYSLVELAAYVVVSEAIRRAHLRRRLHRLDNDLLDGFVPHCDRCEPISGIAQLSADPKLLLPHQFERNRVGVVGLQQLLLLGLKSADAALLT